MLQAEETLSSQQTTNRHFVVRKFKYTDTVIMTLYE